MIVALGLHIGKLIDENVPFFLTDCACVRADRSRPRSPVPHAGYSPWRARRRDTEIRRVTARTDPETVRAHVNRWQTASEHQYPGPYRAFLHEWCRYPIEEHTGSLTFRQAIHRQCLSLEREALGIGQFKPFVWRG